MTLARRYRFVVEAQVNRNPNTSEPKDSGELSALWRMPAGIARYGFRDVGLDDWALTTVLYVGSFPCPVSDAVLAWEGAWRKGNASG